MQIRNSFDPKIKYLFDSKQKILNLFDHLEKSIYNNSEILDEIERNLEMMHKIASKETSTLTKLKIEALWKYLLRFRKRKAYQKYEFDRLYAKLKKITPLNTNETSQENPKINLLLNKFSLRDSFPKNRFKKIKDEYLIINFQRTLYILPKYPNKICKNIPLNKKYFEHKNIRYPIFPLSPLSENFSSKESYSKVILFKTKFEWKPIRYDFIEIDIKMPKEEFLERQIQLEKPLAGIHFFLKWRGNPCYLVDF
jgi:hypothetical protein